MMYRSFLDAINAVPATWKIFPVWDDPDDVWSGYHWEAGEDDSNAIKLDETKGCENQIAEYIHERLVDIVPEYGGPRYNNCDGAEVAWEWAMPWLYGNSRWMWPSKAAIEAYVEESAPEMRRIIEEEENSGI